MMAVEAVLGGRTRAKVSGASRYCMWGLPGAVEGSRCRPICDMVKGVRISASKTCIRHADRIRRKGDDASLDYYNHNIDTSPEFHGEIITTRTYEDQLNTLFMCARQDEGLLRQHRPHGRRIADRAVCWPPWPTCRNIQDRCRQHAAGAGRGTPLNNEGLDPLEFVRTIAVARVMPASMVHRSAGRENHERRCSARRSWPGDQLDARSGC